MLVPACSRGLEPETRPQGDRPLDQVRGHDAEQDQTTRRRHSGF